MAAAGSPLRTVRSSDEKRVLGLCYQRTGEAPALWLANLTAAPQTVRLDKAEGMRLTSLDASSFAAASLDPARFAAAGPGHLPGDTLRLEPYGTAMLRHAVTA